MTQNPPNHPPTPTQVRHLSDWENFCTFADVKVRAPLWNPPDSQATKTRRLEEPAELIH